MLRRAVNNLITRSINTPKQKFRHDTQPRHKFLVCFQAFYIERGRSSIYYHFYTFMEICWVVEKILDRVNQEFLVNVCRWIVSARSPTCDMRKQLSKLNLVRELKPMACCVQKCDDDDDDITKKNSQVGVNWESKVDGWIAVMRSYTGGKKAKYSHFCSDRLKNFPSAVEESASMWDENRSIATSFTCALSHFQLKYNQRDSNIFSVYVQQSNKPVLIFKARSFKCFAPEHFLCNHSITELKKRKINKLRWLTVQTSEISPSSSTAISA